MAKTSKIQKNLQRRQTVERCAQKRANLLAILKNYELPFEEREEARRQLMRLPRDANPIRIRNRCMLTGRPRAYLRKFGISRVMFRDLSLLAEIPGVRKASW
ncbi:MAG: 30S ribosomal protein S14 [Planctomycetes bacterium]|nr:30S ribosomal protein S14 [Planctomycetota bacterium]